MHPDVALKLLRGGTKGIDEWNRRRNAGEEIPDLSGACFRNADLSGANLRDACLVDSDLVDSNLCGADLKGANLSGAVLRNANLKGVNLTESNLSAANLSAANLSSANFSRAKCWYTIFANVILTDVKGLDSILHLRPSTMSIDMLLSSVGKIPNAFLRGCGVPDALIEYLPRLLAAMSPIQCCSCFISHSSKDKPFANRLYARMVQEKLSVWYAPETMRGGRRSADQIDQAIGAHDRLLLALSKASMASDWVKYEIMRAMKREKKEKRQILFPIGLVSRNAIMSWSAFDADSGKDLAKVVREYHIPDFSKWKDPNAFETAFARLLVDLKAGNSTATGLTSQPVGRPKKPH
jgi:hypothetical protein